MFLLVSKQVDFLCYICGALSSHISLLNLWTANNVHVCCGGNILNKCQLCIVNQQSYDRYKMDTLKMFLLVHKQVDFLCYICGPLSLPIFLVNEWVVNNAQVCDGSFMNKHQPSLFNQLTMFNMKLIDCQYYYD